MKLASRILVSLHKRLRLASFDFEALLPYMPRTGKVLDVGCGFGLWLHLLSQRLPLLKLWGVDPDRYKIEEARRLLKRQIDDLPGNKRFDVITILDVLYLLTVSERKKLIKQAFRWLRPQGKLLIAFVPREKSWRYYLAYLQELVMVKRATDFETMAWMRWALKAGGFNRIVVKHLPTPWPWWHRHVLMVATK